MKDKHEYVMVRRYCIYDGSYDVWRDDVKTYSTKAEALATIKKLATTDGGIMKQITLYKALRLDLTLTVSASDDSGDL